MHEFEPTILDKIKPIVLVIIAALVVTGIINAYSIINGDSHRFRIDSIAIGNSIQNDRINIEIYQMEEKPNLDSKYAVIGIGPKGESYIKEWTAEKPTDDRYYLRYSYPTTYQIKTKLTEETFQKLKKLADEYYDYDIVLRVAKGAYVVRGLYVVNGDQRVSIEDYLNADGDL